MQAAHPGRSVEEMEGLVLRLRNKNLELKQVLKSLKNDYDLTVEDLEGYKAENAALLQKVRVARLPCSRAGVSPSSTRLQLSNLEKHIHARPHAELETISRLETVAYSGLLRHLAASMEVL